MTIYNVLGLAVLGTTAVLVAFIWALAAVHIAKTRNTITRSSDDD